MFNEAVLSDNYISIWQVVSINDSCGGVYSSSLPEVISVSGSTLTAMAAGKTVISGTGGVCDPGQTTIEVTTYPNYFSLHGIQTIAQVELIFLLILAFTVTAVNFNKIF